MKTTLLIIALTLASSGADQIPSKAQTLLEKRQEAVDRIDERLNEELEKLKVAYMKEGDLDGANAVNALISSKDKSVTTDSSDPIVGTTWNFLGSNRQKINEFQFLKGGKVKCESTYKDANWRRLDSKTILFGYTSEGGYIVLYSDNTGKYMGGLHKGGTSRSIQRIR